MELHEQVLTVHNYNDLAHFIESMHNELVTCPNKWENNNLPDFLEAMTGWITSADGYYSNSEKPMPSVETWQTIATMLLASTMYE